MRKAITYVSAGHQNTPAEIEVPKSCPVCNLLMTVSYHNVAFNPTTQELQAVFSCTNDDCRSFFLTYYKSAGGQIFELQKFEPPNLTQQSFPDFVKDISPKFLEIYKEAHEAKQRALNHIAGPGYRKAFEFLIKDYAKSIDKSKSDKIEQAFAGDVVNDFISDLRVQAVAKRALWIGNDESHYLRKWVDFDVNDLINLIQLTIDWIEIERESKSYVDAMTRIVKSESSAE